MHVSALVDLETFEVDSFDAMTRSGWSVLVQGIANEVTVALDHAFAHLQTFELSPWAPGTRPRLLRISMTTGTGRPFKCSTPTA